MHSNHLDILMTDTRSVTLLICKLRCYLDRDLTEAFAALKAAHTNLSSKNINHTEGFWKFLPLTSTDVFDSVSHDPSSLKCDYIYSLLTKISSVLGVLHMVCRDSTSLLSLSTEQANMATIHFSWLVWRHIEAFGCPFTTLSSFGLSFMCVSRSFFWPKRLCLVADVCNCSTQHYSMYVQAWDVAMVTSHGKKHWDPANLLSWGLLNMSCIMKCKHLNCWDGDRKLSVVICNLILIPHKKKSVMILCVFLH